MSSTLKSAVVILDDKRPMVISLLQQHAHVLGIGVLQDIMQRFLDDPVKIGFDILWQTIVEAIRFDPICMKFGCNFILSRPFANKAAQSIDKAQIFEHSRAKLP